MGNSNSTPSRAAMGQEAEASDGGEVPEVMGLRGGTSIMDQLSLQALVYSRSHPEFVSELNDALVSGALDAATAGASTTVASRSTREQASTSGRSGSALSPDALRARVQAKAGISNKPDAAANNRLVMLLEGRLDGEDPATVEPLVVHWSEEEEAEEGLKQKGQAKHSTTDSKLQKGSEWGGAMRAWRQGRSHAAVREEVAARSSAKKAQQAGKDGVGQASGEESEEEESEYDYKKDRNFSDDGWYTSNASALNSWLAAQSSGRLPLPRGAPRAWLLFKPDAPFQAAGSAALLPEWLQAQQLAQGKEKAKSAKVQEEGLEWRLPWALV